ncbi:MAG: hypothetical protein ACXWVR_06800 [Rhodoplanes sp.]
MSKISHVHSLGDTTHACVLVDHAMWITRVREHVYGSLRLDSAAVGRTDSCALAGWFRASEPQLSHLPDYWRCLALHTRWHDCAARVVDLASQGRRLEAELAMAPGGQLRCLSAELVSTFARLRQNDLDGDARAVPAHDFGVYSLEP